MSEQQGKSIWDAIDALAAARFWNEIIRYVCKYLVLTILVIFSAMVIDFLFRLESTFVRAFLLTMSVVLWFVWTSVTVFRRVRSGSDSAKAAEIIEDYNNIESGRLQNALLIQNHLRGQPTRNLTVVGSDELCQEAVNSVAAKFRDVVTPPTLGRERTAEWFLGFVCLAGVCIVLTSMFYPQMSWALKRLALPFVELRWPTTTRLEFVALPGNIAIGESVDVQIVNRKGALPENLVVEVRNSPDSEIAVHSVSSDGKTGRYRLADIKRDIQIRAKGGDDQAMAWRDIRVSRPAELNEVLVKIQPPAIYNLPERVVPDRVAEVITGSTVSVVGNWDTAVQDAEIRFIESNLSNSQLLNPEIRFVMNDDHSFSIVGKDKQPFAICESIEFEIHWITSSGLRQSTDERWLLRCIDDEPPEVAWESSIRSLETTVNGIIPLDFLLKDDFGIRSFDLKYVDNRRAEYFENVNIGANMDLDDSKGDLVSPKGILVGTQPLFDYSRELHLSRLIEALGGESTEQPRFVEVRVSVTDWIGQFSETDPIRITVVTEQRARTKLQLRLGDVSQSLSQAIQMGESFLQQSASADALRDSNRQLEIAKQKLREFYSDLSKNRDSVLNTTGRLNEQNRRSGVNDLALDDLSRQIETELGNLVDTDLKSVIEKADDVDPEQFLKALPWITRTVSESVVQLSQVRDRVASEQSSLAVDQLIRSASARQQALNKRLVNLSEQTEQSVSKFASEQMDLAIDFEERFLRLQTTADEMSAQRLTQIARERIVESMRLASKSIDLRDSNRARKYQDAIQRSLDTLMGQRRSMNSRNDQSNLTAADDSALKPATRTDLLELLEAIRAEQSVLNNQVARAKERLESARESNERNEIWSDLQLMADGQSRLSERLAKIVSQIQLP